MANVADCPSLEFGYAEGCRVGARSWAQVVVAGAVHIWLGGSFEIDDADEVVRFCREWAVRSALDGPSGRITQV